MTTLIPKFDLKDGGATPTGAINRTIYQKLSDIVSVKDFGAVGDGTTDDTTAIQAALSLGKPVYIPYTANGYLISSTLTATANVTCDGFLLAATNFSSIVFNVQGGTYAPGRIIIEGISVKPKTSLVTGSIGIRVFSPNVELRNCFATQFDYGMQVASYTVTLNNCWSRQNNTNLSAYAPSSVQEINDLMCINCSFDSANVYSCYIGDTRFSTTVLSTNQMGVNVIFINCDFEGAPSLFNRVFNLTLQNCYWETTTSSNKGIVLENTMFPSLMRNVTISGCYFKSILYPIYCNSAVRNLLVENNYFSGGDSYCGLYYVELGGAGSFQYLRNETTNSFLATEVHTGYLSVSSTSVTFQGVTIYDDFLFNGVQNTPLESSTGNWYSNGKTQDNHQNISSSSKRFKSSPATSIAGTLSSFAFTCTTLTDSYKFNGGDAFVGTGAAASGGFIQSVDYVTGVITLSLAGGPSSGAATISQVAVTFS